MNLAPYIEFLLKLQANSLVLQANQIPRLQLQDKEKTIGKKIVNVENINSLINNFLDNSQKKELLKNKKIRSIYTTSKGIFTIQIEKSVNNYILKISPRNKPTIKSKEDITPSIRNGNRPITYDFRSYHFSYVVSKHNLWFLYLKWHN